MKILIVTATEKEIELLIQKYLLLKSGNRFQGEIDKHQIQILVTGIGIPNTIFHLTRLLERENYDMIINAGIAGYFNDNYTIGEVVNVTSECFADIGYEDGEKFIPFTKTNLIASNDFPFTNGWLNNNSLNPVNNYKKVKGITVNRVHGNEDSINEVIQIYNPDVETMEGAAVAFCCLQYHTNYIEIRSLSNKVEKRNKGNWNLELAFKNLNLEVEQFIKQLK